MEMESQRVTGFVPSFNVTKAAARNNNDDDDVPFRSSSKSFPLESGGRGGDFLSTGRRGRIRPQRRRSAEFLLAHRRPMRLLGLASPR